LVYSFENQDFKRIGEETSDENDVIDDDTMSMDSVASFGILVNNVLKQSLLSQRVNPLRMIL
jgi:hypothetical protein